MPRCPIFYLLGALAGLALWLVAAPTPFPFLGLTAMICGALGFVVSLAYIASFEPSQWQSMLSRARSAGRAINRLLDRLDTPPTTASEIRASRAKSSSTAHASTAARA